MIKLRSDQSKLQADAEYFAKHINGDSVLLALAHDAAVAHALIAELDELAAADINYVGLVLTLKRRTAKRLRSDFGIDAANGFGEQQ